MTETRPTRGEGAASSADGRPVTEVAVGVIIRPDGSFLLAQRPAGKPYAGYWEFPGGKLETGETVAHALARELEEELGLDIVASEAWRVLEHDYPHAYVRLHFCKIHNWRGEPVGREGQAFRWHAPGGAIDPAVQPLLPAALPVIEWLAAELPR
ncbi:NUDIX domain-containing protein [Chitinasiproducens palmae]|uniref:8-oxo-dGTP diphosphatase n=1 Tax=Chitinasiproducens palmae TaxID=1770053 RepID=A0A1H2PRQ6_9BURK|nr:NUDIX domain-containing protein [Chitinasiproducens palmae]SDV49575.1 8-oxo-dGTPase [Chitinasiproducens palmae]